LILIVTDGEETPRSSNILVVSSSNPDHTQSLINRFKLPTGRSPTEIFIVNPTVPERRGTTLIREEFEGLSAFSTAHPGRTAMNLNFCIFI